MTDDALDEPEQRDLDGNPVGQTTFPVIADAVIDEHEHGPNVLEDLELVGVQLTGKPFNGQRIGKVVDSTVKDGTLYATAEIDDIGAPEDLGEPTSIAFENNEDTDS